MVVYLDGFVGLNFLVDWLLLLGVNRMAGFPMEMGRTAAAAALGGGYAGMCLVPGFSFLASNLWRGVSLGLISMTAFGMERSALRRGVLFVVMSFALGGLALSMNSGRFLELVGCAGLLGGLCWLGFRGKAGGARYHTLLLRHGGQCVEVTALEDTGNNLRDPITGEGMIVVDRNTAKALTGMEEWELRAPVETLARRPELGLRLVPYKTVGQGKGFLMALRCDSLTLDGKPYGTLVALAPEVFGDGEYGALTGGM